MELEYIREVELLDFKIRGVLIRVRTNDLCIFLGGYNRILFNKVGTLNINKTKELYTELKNFIWI